MSALTESQLWSMTVPRLRDLIRERGIQVGSATRKIDLISRILEHQSFALPLLIQPPPPPSPSPITCNGAPTPDQCRS